MKWLDKKKRQILKDVLLIGSIASVITDTILNIIEIIKAL